jgi:hypothetical protein
VVVLQYFTPLLISLGEVSSNYHPKRFKIPEIGTVLAKC